MGLRGRRWDTPAQLPQPVLAVGKELLVGGAQIVRPSVRVVIAHKWTAVVADVGPCARCARWVPSTFSLAESNGLVAAGNHIELLLVQVSKAERLLHVKVTGIHIAVVLYDHIVPTLFLELADLRPVPGKGQEKIVKEAN